MKTVCMIPARAGSKRIPNKNIKDFCGKSIITYPIETAKESGIFDDIVVYTDDIKIQEIAMQNNVLWTDRKDTNDYETLTETILKFIILFDIIPDYLCILLPTAVFVDDLSIFSEAIANIKDYYNCVITFCQYSHPIQRAFTTYGNKIKMIDNEYEFARTQDLTPNYYDAGQMYFLNVKSFLEQKRIFMKNIYPIIIDAMDIDNPEDWGKAEIFYKYQRGLI